MQSESLQLRKISQFSKAFTASCHYFTYYTDSKAGRRAPQRTTIMFGYDCSFNFRNMDLLQVWFVMICAYSAYLCMLLVTMFPCGLQKKRYNRYTCSRGLLVDDRSSQAEREGWRSFRGLRCEWSVPCQKEFLWRKLLKKWRKWSGIVGHKD